MAWAQGAKVSADNPGQTERDRPHQRARWFMRGRTVDGKPASTQLHRAYEQKLNNRRLQAQPRLQPGAAQGTSAPRPLFIPQPSGGPVWTPLGPAPTATAALGSSQQDYGPAVGRVTAVVVDQIDTSGNTVYLGGASGGLWRSTNAVSASRSCNSGGVCTAPVVWTPLIDGQATLTVGAIALQPGNSNLILVGTGEANNSADSYYGLGILRSTDGGANWTLISKTANAAFDFHGLGFTHIAFSTDNPNLVVATAAAASGGIGIGAETGGASARGIYYSTDAGATWSRATVSDGGTTPDAGSANAVIYNPAQHKFYANLRFHGFYSSSDGATWTRLATQPPPVTSACTSSTNSTCPLYRAEMALVPGRDEMYVWIIDSTENDRGIFQTKNGGQIWTAISTAGIDTCGDGVSNGCGGDSTGQATYNLTLAAVPNGSTATDLYAGGVNQYKCSIDPASNPACELKPFINLTHVYASCAGGAVGAFAHVHPDQHGIDFSVSNPAIIYFGNDGGVYRTLNGFTTNTATCNGTLQPQLQFDNLSGMMGSMIQFVGFSHHPSDASTLLGGTQDNGSPAVSGAAPSSGSWLSVNNGDGGFNAINPLSPNEWFTSNPAPLDSSGGIQRCTNGIGCTFLTIDSRITQQMIGGDFSSFYTFFTLDPQASGRMLVGSCRLWRGNSDGSGSDWSVTSNGGNPLTLNLNTQVVASCADPTDSPTTFMVNTIAAGGPCNGPCNPGITPGSGTGGGSQVIWAGMEGIADATSAAAQCTNRQPCGGQVWRTLNADSGTGSWSEVSGLNGGVTAACTTTPSACNINPRHYTISAIALDLKDTTGRTAYVTVMGFGVGHVFKTTDAGATWAKLDGVGDPLTTPALPDAPADAVAADPNVANLIYVGTDVGVFKSTGDGNWTELGPASGAGSLPNVVVTQLKIYNNPSDSIPLRLRASTYGRGIWEIAISPEPGYSVAVSNPVLQAFAGKTASFSGVITPFNGYTNSINITCTGSALPATCPTSGSPVTVPAPATSGNFSVVAGHPSVGDFTFNLTAVGSDPKGVTQQAPVTLHSVDFSLGVVSAATVGAGDSADVNFDVTSRGNFTGNVSFTCSGQPAGTTCNFSPAIASLTPGATASVRLLIPTSASTAAGSYSVTITGASTVGGATQSHSTPLALTMTVNSSSQSFTLAAAGPITVVTVPPSSSSTAKPGQTLTADVTLTAGSAFAGTLALSCAFDPAFGSSGASTCILDKTSVTLAGIGSASAKLTVNTVGAVAANPRVTVTATDVPNNASSSVGFNYSVIDYSLALTTPVATVPGGATSVAISVAAQNGYAGNVAATCSATSPLTCTLNPAGPFALNANSVSANASITVPANTPPNTYSVSINTNDTAAIIAGPPPVFLTHNQSVTVSVQDFQIATTTTETVKAGGTPTPHVINITGLGGFSGAVTLTCSNLPALTTCQFPANNNASQVTIAAGSSTTLNIQTTAPSVSGIQPPAGSRAAPLYAFWISMPGIVVGLVGMGVAPRNGRRKLLGYVGLALLLGIILLQTACGGGGGASTTTPPPVPKPGTPAGTYTITVSGSSNVGGVPRTNSTQITLTVQ